MPYLDRFYFARMQFGGEPVATETLDRPCTCGHTKKVHRYVEGALGGYTVCYGSHRCPCREYVPKED